MFQLISMNVFKLIPEVVTSYDNVKRQCMCIQMKKITSQNSQSGAPIAEKQGRKP